MNIGGFQKLSLSDYPGKISAIIFTQGCNFRCPYCHNPELVDPASFTETLDAEAVFSFLETRRTKLQGIVVTGGEPILQPDIPCVLGRLKDMGFGIKLDTNGSDPEILGSLLDMDLIDYCAMDIKAPIRTYGDVIRAPVDRGAILESIRVLGSSGIDHEFRTTFEQSLLSGDEVLEIGTLVPKGSRLVLQGFRPTKCLDAGFRGHPPTAESTLSLLQNKLAAEGVVSEVH